MSVFDRLGRVASANFNALLERLESPGKSFDLTLREMQDCSRQARRELVVAVAAEKQLESRIAEREQAVTVWERRARCSKRR